MKNRRYTEIMDDVIEFKLRMMEKYILEKILKPEIDFGTPEKFAEKKADMWTEADRALLGQVFPRRELVKAQFKREYQRLLDEEKRVRELEGRNG